MFKVNLVEKLIAIYLIETKNRNFEVSPLQSLKADDKIVTVAGYRYLEFLVCSKSLYIDDFSTAVNARGKGYGKRLLGLVN